MKVLIEIQIIGLLMVMAASATSTFSRTMPVVSPGQTDFTTAAEISVHAVVHVKTKIPVMRQQNPFSNDPFFEYFFGPQQQFPQHRESPMQEAAGSGVIISNDGYIVTNNHVIDRSAEI